MSRRPQRVLLPLVAVVALLGVTGCGNPAAELPSDASTTPAAQTPSASESSARASQSVTPTPTPTPGASPAGAAQGTAWNVLATLPVKGRAPMSGFDRDRFGQAWLDADRNGCDTRNDVLGRDLSDVQFAAGTGDCKVLTGVLHDPYTAQVIDFFYGDGTLVDIDHVVALGNVWVTGGFAFDVEKRAAIANDPMNLLGVDASANRQKGDGDAATWLPSNTDYRCAYVARQVAVKAKYSLWVTAPERAAMERVLDTCPDEPPAVDSGVPVRVTLNITDPGATPTSSSGTGTGGSGSSSGTGDDGTAGVYFENCDAARAAGAAPVHRGDPGYGSHLDGDGDGSACE